MAGSFMKRDASAIPHVARFQKHDRLRFMPELLG